MKEENPHLLAEVRRRPGLEGAHILVKVNQVQPAKALSIKGGPESRRTSPQHCSCVRSNSLRDTVPKLAEWLQQASGTSAAALRQREHIGSTASSRAAAHLREEALRDAQLVHNGGLHGEGGESGGCTSQAGLVARCSKVSLCQRCSWCPTRPASGGPTWCSCPAGPQAPPPLT